MTINQAENDFSFYHNTDTINLLKGRKILLGDETIEQLFERVVTTLLNAEKNFNTSEIEVTILRQKTFAALSKREIVFGSPLLTNAGRDANPLSSCTVIPVDLKKSFKEIKSIITPYFQASMGSGFNLDDVEDPVTSLRGLNTMLLQLEAHTKRPPCGMALLSVSHPKVIDFITMKKNDDFSKWRFNLSIGVTAAFMRAVQNNQEWIFKDGSKIQAKKIFDEAAKAAHFCGEPGILFMDTINKNNPVPSLEYKSVSPCAEVAMAEGEVCQFSYVNLAAMVHQDENGISFNFKALQDASALLTRLLDNAVEISIENAVGSKEIIASKRSINIGVCGFADLLIQLHIPYGSRKSLKLLGEILSIINYQSKLTSVELAQKRGAFPSFSISRYLDKKWCSRFKKYETEHVTAAMWKQLSQQIAINGLRNACTTALPPTSISAGMVHASQSIEPIFTCIDSTGHLRKDVKELVLQSLQKKAITHERQEEILKIIEKEHSISEKLQEISLQTRKILFIAQQIQWKQHLQILAKAQKYIDGGVSKTVNLPNNISVASLQECLMTSYRLNAKGITVFRDRCLADRKL